MISVEQLQAAINEVAHTHASTPRPVEHLPLLSAVGYVLAENIVADFDIPRQNLSAMDGFAFAVGSELSAGNQIDIVGESCAGRPFEGELSCGQGVRIFTGAVVPAACDCVVMQENTDWQAIASTVDKSQNYAITLSKAAEIGANIRKQGEEVAAGERVLAAGKRLNPADVSLLANLGVAQVAVYAPLTVGLIATGDELVALGHELPNLASIYNSNTPTLKTLLKDLPIVIKDYGIIADDLQATCDAVAQAVKECDVLISSAGVSVGDYDYLTHAIDALGKITHYKVAMKPGKPFVFGELYDDARTVLYFGLPGNPLSCVVGCLQFIKPALWRLAKVSDDDLPKRLVLKAKLMADFSKKAGRKEYARGVYHQDEQGEFHVTFLGAQDSHRIKQLAYANCLIAIDKDDSHLQKGDMVSIEPFVWGLL
ncbi:molybdopterin molybdenumtransferase MoeA [Moraxella caviae]|uniref:Molybdopterin molybdenumtransferase n=1 Tax=Moraxella caviae TaxID=34060 RepID=A0A1T0A5M7_9GAMM|nr:gephyrin-like molybdotransferase Glp [Moraxella caviae]OOR91092.1 molybdopterin molybdenumtransferase MoeA [Moraxella caviae]STZ14211.1 Molybdopterin molybdenumtransferase [Moraxella caviae]VEW13454.1 Molybdopterin molybdenumtransferase [Moraxella caviae]